MHTNIDRAELADAYAQWLLDHMDGRDLETFFLDCTTEKLDCLSFQELLREVEDACPELLQEAEA